MNPVNQGVGGVVVVMGEKCDVVVVVIGGEGNKHKVPNEKQVCCNYTFMSLMLLCGSTSTVQVLQS